MTTIKEWKTEIEAQGETDINNNIEAIQTLIGWGLFLQNYKELESIKMLLERENRKRIMKLYKKD